MFRIDVRFTGSVLVCFLSKLTQQLCTSMNTVFIYTCICNISEAGIIKG